MGGGWEGVVDVGRHVHRRDISEYTRGGMATFSMESRHSRGVKFAGPLAQGVLGLA